MPLRRAGSAPGANPGILPGYSGGDLHFHCAFGFRMDPMTRAHVRLLGPCFKTGRVEHRPIRHRPFAQARLSGRDAPAPRLPRTDEAVTRRSGDGRGAPGTWPRGVGVLGPATCRPRRAVTPGAPDESDARGTFPPGLLTADGSRSWLSARRKCTQRLARDARRGNEVSPLNAGRGAASRRAEFPGSNCCGSTRLPLCGFTYS